MIILSPSLLASDFTNLETEIKKIYNAGCEYIHLDVMDGVFVKNITFGIPVIAAMRKVCGIIFDTHLMIVNPIRYIDEFARSGCDIITFHHEACDDDREIFATIEKIKANNIKCAMAIKPNTAVEKLLPFLHLLDMALIMSVEPGFGGQAFIPDSFEKLKYLKRIKAEKNLMFDIQVDGGVNLKNISEIKEAGANVIVAGTSIFRAEDINDAVQKLINL